MSDFIQHVVISMLLMGMSMTAVASISRQIFPSHYTRWHYTPDASQASQSTIKKALTKVIIRSHHFNLADSEKYLLNHNTQQDNELMKIIVPG